MATQDEKGIQIILCDQSNIGFVLEQSQGTQFESVITAPSAFRIIPTSVVIEEAIIDGKKTKVRRKIRYIRESESIYVDEQVKQGYPAMGYKTPVNDVIWVINGKLWVANEGASKNLYEYLKKYEGNKNNPNRPENAKDIFYEHQPAKEAIGALEKRNIDKAAREIVDGLYEKGPGGFNFNVSSVDFIAATFGVPETMSTQEKVEAIYTLSERNPMAFVSTLERKQNIVEVDVKFGVDKSIIDISTATIRFATSGEVLYETKKNKKPEKIQELIGFFMLPENKIVYVQLQELIQERHVAEIAQ